MLDSLVRIKEISPSSSVGKIPTNDIQPHPVSKLDHSRCRSVLWGSCLHSSGNLLLQHLANSPWLLVILLTLWSSFEFIPFKPFFQIFCSFTNVGFLRVTRLPSLATNCAVSATQTRECWKGRESYWILNKNPNFEPINSSPDLLSHRIKKSITLEDGK